MTSLVRFDPWGMMRDLDRLFDDGGRRSGDGAWIPRVDVFERDVNLVLRAEIPGVDPEHIGVTVERGTLTITGTRGFEKDEEIEGGLSSQRDLRRPLQEIRITPRGNRRRCRDGDDEGRDPRGLHSQEAGGSTPEDHRRRPAVIPPSHHRCTPARSRQRSGPDLVAGLRPGIARSGPPARDRSLRSLLDLGPRTASASPRC